ncbi:unnamed protein product [Discula destructiva]
MSKRRETAIEAMDAFAAWDIERILAYRDEDCIHQVVPSSLSRPPYTNASYRAYFGSIMPLFTNFTPKVHMLVEDADANTVAIWCSSKAETVIGDYDNEYTLLLHFNEVGDKVTKFIEFVDTDSSKKFFGRLREYVEAQKGMPMKENGEVNELERKP